MQSIGQSITKRFLDLAQSNKLAHAYIVETFDANKSIVELANVSKLLLCSNLANETIDETFNQSTNNNIDNNIEELDSIGCGQCKSCQLHKAGNHPDLKVLNGKSESIGIDDIRLASDWLNKTAQISNAQVIIIEYAQNMTENAANALLKTLEEPTNNSFIILLNVGAKKLLPTIRSRCQIIKAVITDKATLSELYSDLPSYLIGFSAGNLSLLDDFRNETQQASYTEIYTCFIHWLKNQSSHNALVRLVLKDKQYQVFFIYLINRRIRQMLIKGYLEKGQQAEQALVKFNFAQQHIKGQNKELALSALLEKLEHLVK